MPIDPTQLFHVKDAAILLGTTKGAVYQLVARRTIPFRKLNGRVIFLKDELEDFLRALPGCRPDEAAHNVAVRNGEAR